MANPRCTRSCGRVGIVALCANISCMRASDIYACMTSYINNRVTFYTEFGCGCQILIFIDGWDRQPGKIRINLTSLNTMADVAWNVFPISFCYRWGRRGNLKFAGCTTRWHIVHRGDIVDWRMTARTRAVHSRFIQYISMRVGACFPQGLNRVCGYFCRTDGYLGSPGGAPLI